MSKKEYYYTAEWYSHDLEPLLGHIAEYLSGDRTVPVMKTKTQSGHLLFTFSNDLCSLFLENPGKIRKPYECALKYRFRGYSAGGKNGIFLLRKQDQNLAAVTDSLVERYRSEITQDLDCKETDLPNLKKVKIVYHSPSGERMVGVMNESNDRAIFLGYASY